MDEELKAEDLRIDTYHAGEHSGFLHTNQTAVRITHLPTGVFVESKDERSVHANKQRCLDLLPEAIASMNTRAQSAPEPGQGEAVEYQQLSRYNNWDRIDKEVYDLGKLGKSPERFRALYTAADKPDAELVELLREAVKVLDCWKTTDDLDAIQERIVAKLAELHK